MTRYRSFTDWKDVSIELLNELFTPLRPWERLERLYRYFPEHEILVTSSFGTQSALLLYWINRVCPGQTIYFIDTTYHFPETLAYKDQLSRQLGLEVVDLRPAPAENALTREKAWWASHPRMCCAINKVAPLEPIKEKHRIWISGLMAYQTEFRARLRVFEKQGDIVKFHPLIDLEEGEFLYYFGKNGLPEHPLAGEGYGSIGCTHCTERGEGRSGRWQGSNQTECGLHPGYFVRRGKG
jgi:phosphoadenosine phosphosulfate reductase